MDYALAQAEKISAQLGYILIDAELVKESTGRFLRFYIDREGGISLDDCEAFHKKIHALMDNVDYDYMEVSSPGADRPLKTAADYGRAMGMQVELKLYRAQEGIKLIRGELAGFADGQITLHCEDGTQFVVAQTQVALAKPYLDFSEEDLQDEIEIDGGEE